MISQNVAFAGIAPAHEDDGFAPGHALALSLRGQLLAKGWVVSEPDAWGGSGWSVECRSKQQELQVSLASAAGSEWMIQIAPLYYYSESRCPSIWHLGAPPTAYMASTLPDRIYVTYS